MAARTDLNKVLKIAAASTAMSTPHFSFAGGMNIARNIPYKTLPRAEDMESRRMFPEKAPRKVPLTQPRAEITVRPFIYNREKRIFAIRQRRKSHRLFQRKL